MLEETGLTGAWPTGLDPATDGNGSANQSYMDAIYGNLFQLGADGKLIPDLALSATPSDGGKTYTIALRPGVKFSDGTPFNAAAVAWNFQQGPGQHGRQQPALARRQGQHRRRPQGRGQDDRAVRGVHQHVPRRQRELDRLRDRGEGEPQQVQADAGRRRPVHRGQRHRQLRAGAQGEPDLLAEGPPVPEVPHLQVGGQRRGRARDHAGRGRAGVRGHADAAAGVGLQPVVQRPGRAVHLAVRDPAEHGQGAVQQPRARARPCTTRPT